MILESRGIPVATVCTDAFAALAQSEAAAQGLDLPLVVIPHPLGSLAPDQVSAAAQAAVAQVIRVLTGEPGAGVASATDRISVNAISCSDDICRYEPMPLGPSLTVQDSLVGLEEVNSRFYAAGWTDGLPIAIPTEAKVHAALEYLKCDPNTTLGVVPPKRTPATVEKIVINALMAGCETKYLPVVLAAVEAMLDPKFELGGVQTTTGPHAPLVVVNGPIAGELDVNGGHGAFGPGWQSNATIGRAVRLILLNLGGATPGSVDKSTQGHPSKYTYCIAENQAVSPWEPLHVERGFAAEDSTVTLIACHNPVNIHDTVSTSARGVLTTAADTMTTIGGSKLYRAPGEVFLLLCPEHANLIASEDWSKDDVRHYIFEHARRTRGDLKHGGMSARETVWPQWLADDDNARVPLVERASNILVLVVGGAGRHSSYLITWTASRSVTKAIRIPGLGKAI